MKTIYSCQIFIREEFEGLIFGSNFAGISDLVVGPDGYLYVLSFGSGAIYRIVPVDVNEL